MRKLNSQLAVHLVGDSVIVAVSIGAPAAVPVRAWFAGSRWF